MHKNIDMLTIKISMYRLNFRGARQINCLLLYKEHKKYNSYHKIKSKDAIDIITN